MTSPDDATPVATLSRALVECLAPVTQILDHMARAPAAPDIPAAVAQLRRTLDDVLAPLGDEFAAADVTRAAEIVDRGDRRDPLRGPAGAARGRLRRRPAPAGPGGAARREPRGAAAAPMNVAPASSYRRWGERVTPRLADVGARRHGVLHRGLPPRLARGGRALGAAALRRDRRAARPLHRPAARGLRVAAGAGRRAARPLRLAAADRRRRGGDGGRPDRAGRRRTPSGSRSSGACSSAPATR